MNLSIICTATDIEKALGVSARNIQLYAKSLREKGPTWFFNRLETRGACYKMDKAGFSKAQEMLDLGKTNREIGRALGVTDSAIAYHIRQGMLKKKEIDKP
jgi:predicted transcriptional regulator